MGLSKEEAEQLKALQAKAKEPDAPQVARSLNITVDLGDDAQVERARKLGLRGFEAFGSDDGEGEGEGGDGDEPPKRRGFFAEDA